MGFILSTIYSHYTFYKYAKTMELNSSEEYHV